MASIKVLEGQVIKAIEGAKIYGDEIIFSCADGRKYKMYHEQECCEAVEIVDITGDIEDLLNTPICEALEEVSSVSTEPEHSYGNDEATATFYTFRPHKGTVTIRWLGESNGYYSESVDFEELKQ